MIDLIQVATKPLPHPNPCAWGNGSIKHSNTLNTPLPWGQMWLSGQQKGRKSFSWSWLYRGKKVGRRLQSGKPANSSWSTIARTKGGKCSFSWRRGGLLGIPCTVCVGSTTQDESKRPREEKSCAKVGRGSWESLVLTKGRRGAVSWPLLPNHQPDCY